MKKKKFPRRFRIIRYSFNCLWYQVLVPIGMEIDGFGKILKDEKCK